MKRVWAIACAGALLLALAACAGGSAGSGGTSAGSADGGSSQGTDGSSAGGQTGGSQDSSSQQGEIWTASLYIGTEGQFQEYPLELERDVRPEDLVAGIARLTGWNLDLADEITDGKGGMTVSFAQTSALFAGPPEEQKEEFRVYDGYQLCQTILDSVRETLQRWAVDPELGDPDAVDIYFCGPDGGDLVLEDLGVTIPSAEPYQSFPTGE